MVWLDTETLFLAKHATLTGTPMTSPTVHRMKRNKRIPARPAIRVNHWKCDVMSLLLSITPLECLKGCASENREYQGTLRPLESPKL